MSTFRHDRAGTPAAAWRAHPGWDSVEVTGADDLLDPSRVDRLVVVAAHPDDETLGAGGLLATAARAGLAVDVVTLTAGEHSHPRSPTRTPDALAALRREESEHAVRLLAPGAGTTWVGLEDGSLAEHVEAVVGRLVGLLGDGARTLLVAPWRSDGHPDHDAAGLAAATAAHRCGARLLEYPVWWWHWGDPTATWPPLVRLALDPDALARKHAALDAHASQVRPLSAEPGDEVLLGPEVLAHFTDAQETFVREAPVDGALEELHAGAADPWGVEDRAYERRKRALSLAALPRRRFRRGLELGCSIGALTEDLAPRCDALVALDSSPSALRAARARPGLAAVELVRADLATEPLGTVVDGSFDLVVLSEVGYFLSPATLAALMAWTREALTPDGVVLLCHWTHPIQGWPLDGPAVHALARRLAPVPVQSEVRERDFEVLVLAAADVWPRATG